jgi:inner membrane protein
MASAPTHALAALAIGAAFSTPRWTARCWVLGAVCAALPDADVLSFRFGIAYGDLLGHRGLTHSLLFAAALAGAVTTLCFRAERWRGERIRLFAFLFVATASHGVLDALTSGGLGVAFFAPFDSSRYFFPWRPILVSPIGVGRFLGERGLRVLASEALWVWLPAAVLACVAWAVRRRTGDAPAPV